MRRLVPLAVLAALAATSGRAWAIPAFARKYHTSCTTCHTIFPKLTPFGEQFRRNGFRFPGVDSDYTKAEPIELGTDAQKKTFPNSVWPGLLSPIAPLALGFNGQAIFHPDTSSSAGQADNGTVFNLDTAVEEAHLWAGGSIDDSITFFSELTASADGIEVENASLQFNDLIGPKHAVNLYAGKRVPTLSSFGPHSTYVADMGLPQVSVLGLYGATSDPFAFNDNHGSIEVNGVLANRFDYSLGVAAGTNVDFRNSADVYAHIGYKIGGANLTGEDVGSTPQDLDHETSITIDAFSYRSVSHFTDASMAPTRDTALVVGGAIRAQDAQLELDAGAYGETDDHVMLGSAKVTTVAQWDELSYLAYPWLVFAARVDYLQVKPDGASTVNDLKITPAIEALVRPNLRLSLIAPIERASGMPDGGWAAAGLDAAPSSPTATVGPEIESLELGLFTAF